MIRTVNASRRVAGAVVVFVTLAVLVASCGISADNPPTLGGSGEGGYDVRIEFTSALNLPARAKVLSEGAEVGAVDSVDYDRGHAVVTARIKDKAVLPADSRAELRQDTLLGEIYVALLPPSQPSTTQTLHSGSVIPLSLIHI